MIEKPEHLRRQRFMIICRGEQACSAVADQVGNTADVCRCHWQAAGPGFEYRQWHVVDGGTLQVDVVSRVVRPYFLRRNTPDKFDIPKPQVCRESTQTGLVGATSNERQARVGPMLLDDSERAERAGDVVVSFEVPRGEHARSDEVTRVEWELGP